MGFTIAEKLIANHCGKRVTPGELVIVDVDAAMASDTTAPQAIRSFQQMGGTKVLRPQHCIFVIDHASPAPNEKVANLHQLMRKFANEMGCVLYDTGSGICHHIMLEQKHAQPGNLVLGADSHTCTYGAIGAFATGVGSTDLAAVLLTGKTWLKVPQTIKVELNGTPKIGVTAKDIILYITGKIGMSGATYDVIEYCGETVQSMSLAGRITLANMSSEMGAKSGIVNPAGLKLPYDFKAIYPDGDAEYSREFSFDLTGISPKLSFPSSPENVHNIEDAIGTPINLAYIGTCTNAHIEDLQIAAQILKGQQVAKNVRLLIQPASDRVFQEAIQNGTYQTLTKAGAIFLTTGCGPCVGTHFGIPGDGEVVISTANRNFPGRMGNRRAKVYLASPATVAASSINGVITDPCPILQQSTEVI